MKFNCNPYLNCVPAQYNIPSNPTWQPSQAGSYTISITNGQPFTYNIIQMPSWAALTVTPDEITVAGNRPAGDFFEIEIDLLSCGVTTHALATYQGQSGACLQCLFTLS